MPPLSHTSFRKHIIRQTLFSARGTAEALQRLGFLQADPIRSPARAQDLILRQRVRTYRAGDLERQYPKLPLEECFLYAYGFATREAWELMHPKPQVPLKPEDQAVLNLLQSHGRMHPREVESHIGVSATRNAWGGTSRKAKVILEFLHDRGLLRVAGRQTGIRIYEPAVTGQHELPQSERYQKLLLLTLQAMGATTRGFLLKELGYHGYLAGGRTERQKLLQQLIDQGRVRADLVDDVEYLSLPDCKSTRQPSGRLRILAPFDPVVRDRKRFEHLWGWAYRFEAYVPAKKRALVVFGVSLSPWFCSYARNGTPVQLHLNG